MLKYLIVAAVIVLLPVIGLALLSLKARRPTNLGVHDGRLAECPDTPNCVSSQARDPAHRIEPIAFTGSAETALRRIKQAVEQQPRTTIITETADYLHAEARSRLFRFVDDMEFFADRNASVIHVRSAARSVRSDFGVNRARIEAIRTAFYSL